MFCAQISSNMQRIVKIIDVITIFSSLSFLAYCASGPRYRLLTLYDITWWVLFPLAIFIRICRFTDQRWQLVADRMVMATMVIQPLEIICNVVLAGSEDDLSPYVFALIKNSLVVLVRGRVFRALISVPVVPLATMTALNVPNVPVFYLTCVLGCIWREELNASTSPSAIQKKPSSAKHDPKPMKS